MKLDRLLASTPLNRTAASVASGSSDNYEPEVNLGSFQHWTAPPRTVPPPKAPTFVDLTGRRFGEFRVVGYLGKANPKKKALWLVKCACGDYEARHAPAITSANGHKDCCRNCMHWRVAKGRYARRGAKPLSAFVGGGEGEAT